MIAATSRLIAVLSLAASAVAALPAYAHHSFAAEYDASKAVTLTGTITKIEWTNPHIFLYMDVPDAKTGAAVNWTLEMGGPNALLRLGWKRDSLKVGDLVTVEGSQAKNGSPLVNAKSITMTASGKRMLAGSSGDAGAAKSQ
jgi:hypothetical protein